MGENGICTILHHRRVSALILESLFSQYSFKFWCVVESHVLFFKLNVEFYIYSTYLSTVSFGICTHVHINTGIYMYLILIYICTINTNYIYNICALFLINSILYVVTVFVLFQLEIFISERGFLKALWIFLFLSKTFSFVPLCTQHIILRGIYSMIIKSFCSIIYFTSAYIFFCFLWHILPLILFWQK